MSRIFFVFSLLLISCSSLFAASKEATRDISEVLKEEEEEEENESLPLDLTEISPGDTADTTGVTEVEFSDIFPSQRVYKGIWRHDRVNPYGIRLVDMSDTVLVDMSEYVHPIFNRITSAFGMRRGRYHYGTDLKLKKGDTVRCAFSGMVRMALKGRGYGNFIVVRHDNGLETVYAHFSKLLVRPNDRVKAGDPLGLGGSTGRSTGPHLHFEIRYLGNAINPQEIIDFSTGEPFQKQYYVTAADFEYIKEAEKIRYWTVRKGDTLGAISRKTGVPINTICRLNGIRRTSILRIGNRLRYT